MFKHFIRLEWKSFFRSASLGTSILMKVLMGFFALYMITIFVVAGVSVFFVLKEKLHLEPLATVNKFMIYYLAFDLFIRYFLQKMPVMNIKPLLHLPIQKSTIVHFTLGKTALSFFNWTHAFFFVPFTVILLAKGYGVNAVLWHIGIAALIYANNFLNILINNKDSIFYSVAAVFVGLGLVQYYQLFDITAFTGPFFQSLYTNPILFVVPLIAVFGLYYFAFNYFKKRLNLDEGFAKKNRFSPNRKLQLVESIWYIGYLFKKRHPITTTQQTFPNYLDYERGVRFLRLVVLYPIH